jgi:WD40 repeat protein
MSKEDDLLDEYVLSTDYIADGDPVRCVTSHNTTAAASSPPPQPSMRELVLLVGSQGGMVSRIALPTFPDTTAAAAAAATVGDAVNAETAAVVEIQPGGPNTIHPHQISAILSSSSLSLASSSLLPPLFTTNNNSTDITSSSLLYITGCKDGKIRIINGHTHELVTTLEGHTNAVTSLSWIESSSSNNNIDGDNNNEAQAPWLVSGSWDGTARIWCLHVYVY